MIEERDWKWFGFAGHFIGGNDCLFHLCTEVGEYLVSTVGDYRPFGLEGRRQNESQEIGYNRLYETFVFSLENSELCSCGCGIRKPVEMLEIDSLPASDATSARDNHMTMCRKYATIDDNKVKSVRN